MKGDGPEGPPQPGEERAGPHTAGTPSALLLNVPCPAPLQPSLPAP